jgi:hypothetical protein
MKLLLLIAFCLAIPHAGHDHGTVESLTQSGHAMGFNTNAPTILFENWVPKTTLHYILACVGTIAGAILYDGLLNVMNRIKTNIVRTDSVGSEAGLKAASIIHTWKQKVMGSGIQMAITTLGYLLMFIAMTLNVGLFVSVIVGRGIGSLLFNM